MLRKPCFFARGDDYSTPNTPAGKPAAAKIACPTRPRIPHRQDSCHYKTSLRRRRAVPPTLTICCGKRPNYRGGGQMQALLTDARHALRLFSKAPLWALSVAVTLALGIGAATAMFTVGNAGLLR